ncbi:MAG: type 4a pilus biogenesis protein PilO [Deltaproteobacteria bacterium]|jgi:Tfp pilus assembly protein PilO|nr:type 4a pilus biogenesis protein PilO [Deltaproteobacteria bacterium]
MAKPPAQKPKSKEDFFAKVAKLKTGPKVGILVGGLALVIGVFYMQFYSPYEAKVLGLRNSIADLEKQNKAEADSLAKYKPLNNYAQSVTTTYDYLKSYLTTDNEIPKLIQIISDLGTQAGAKVSLFAPKPAKPLDNYAEIEFQMNLEGTFLNVLKFFYSLSQMDRIINIRSVTMDTPVMTDGMVMNLSVKCQGSTYRFLTPEEIAFLQSKPTGKKK